MIDYTKLSGEMQSRGFIPPAQAVPGKFYRSDRLGKKNNAWYIESEDYASFGDWCTGEKYTYFDDREEWLDEEEAERLRKQRIDMAKRIAEERRKAETEARVALQLKMQTQCQAYRPTAYTERKGIKGAYPDVLTDSEGALWVPMASPSEKNFTVQRILPDGTKRFAKTISTAGKCYCFHGRDESVILCEGWATGASIYEATGLTVYCAMSAHNLRNVYNAEWFADKRDRCYILADWDEPPKAWSKDDKERWPKGTGQKEAEATGIAPERIVYPTAKGDYNDMACEGRDIADYIGKALRPNRIRKLRDLVAEMRPMRWLVQGLIPESSLGVFYGPPGSLKTTMVLDIILRMSKGIPWLGRKTAECNILYACGEGRLGFLQRSMAWEIRNRLEYDSDRMRVFDASDTLDKVFADMDALELREGWKPDLVVLDTWAQFYQRDENSAEEVGKMVRKLRRQMDKGVSFLVIHHATKPNAEGGTSLRGSSALPGAADYIVKCVKGWDENENRSYVSITCEKMKDAEEFRPIAVGTQKVELGMCNDYGEPVTALCMDAECSMEPERADKLDMAENQLINAMQSYGEGEGDSMCIRKDDLRKSLREQGLSDSQIRHWFETTSGRPLGILVREHRVANYDSLIYIRGDWCPPF